MLFKNISILDENFEVRQNMYVGVDAGIILVPKHRKRITGERTKAEADCL